jgi:hypothetical protein
VMIKLMLLARSTRSNEIMRVGETFGELNDDGVLIQFYFLVIISQYATAMYLLALCWQM